MILPFWRMKTKQKIYPYEGANVTEDEYLMIGDAEGGYLLQVTEIHDATSADGDRIKFKDIVNDKDIEADGF